MATEGKHSPFSIKTMLLSGGGFLVAWGATKLLDTYFDTTLLADAKGWLLLDTPMPNWSLLMAALLVLFLMASTCYYFQTARNAYSELEDIETEERTLPNPAPPKLSAAQHKILLRVAHFCERDIRPETEEVRTTTGLSRLEVEVCIEHLIALDYLQWAPANQWYTSRVPALALRGKEYVLRVRSDVRPLLG
jgi:hypothetical protein